MSEDNSNSVKDPEIELLEIEKEKARSGKFDQEFKKLTGRLLAVIKDNNEDYRKMGGKIPVEQTHIENFVKLYDKVDNPEGFYKHFEDLYNKNRKEILKGDTEDGWLQKSKIRLADGMNFKSESAREKARNKVIPLDIVYKQALKLKDEADEILEAGDAEAKYKNHSEHPEYILLHLYRIFHCLIETADSETLLRHLNVLERGLKVELTAKDSLVKEEESNPNGSLQKMFSVATNLMESLGMKLPDHAKKPPSDAKVGEMLSKAMDNNIVKNIISVLDNSAGAGPGQPGQIKTLLDSATKDPSSLVDKFATAIVNNIQQPQQGAPAAIEGQPPSEPVIYDD